VLRKPITGPLMRAAGRTPCSDLPLRNPGTLKARWRPLACAPFRWLMRKSAHHMSRKAFRPACPILPWESYSSP